MSEKIKYGGPAFPVESGPGTGWAEGMSLRDYFAGQALAGLANNWYDCEGMVKDSYRLADAMLKEREATK